MLKNQNGKKKSLCCFTSNRPFDQMRKALYKHNIKQVFKPLNTIWDTQFRFPLHQGKVTTGNWRTAQLGMQLQRKLHQENQHTNKTRDKKMRKRYQITQEPGSLQLPDTQKDVKKRWNLPKPSSDKDSRKTEWKRWYEEHQIKNSNYPMRFQPKRWLYSTKHQEISCQEAKTGRWTKKKKEEEINIEVEQWFSQEVIYTTDHKSTSLPSIWWEEERFPGIPWNLLNVEITVCR